MVSEIFYRSEPVECEDGKTRAVRIKRYRFDGSLAADTFFSVPANTRCRGKYVHGYVTSEDGKLKFIAHDACKL